MCSPETVDRASILLAKCLRTLAAVGHKTRTIFVRKFPLNLKPEIITISSNTREEGKT